MFVRWQAAYEMGVPGIDGDHRLLVDHLNRFIARSQSGAPAAELRGILDGLTKAFAEHFEREEILMERSDVPELASHAAEHNKLIQQMNHFRAPYENATVPELTVDAAQFISSWVLDHIVERDLPCKPYLRRLA